MSSLRVKIFWSLLVLMVVEGIILATAVLDWERLNIGMILANILFECWLVFAFWRKVVRPLEELTRAAKEVRAGTSRTVQVPAHSGGVEVGELAQTINEVMVSEQRGREDERQQALRSQETTKTVLNALPHAVALMSPEGTVEIANAAAQRFGIREGMDVHSFSLQWLPELMEKAQRTQADASLERLVQIFEKGREVFLFPQAHPVKNPQGALTGIALVLLDVTEKRFADEAKSGLVSAMSHQIKTPMTSIQMTIHLLLEDTKHPLTARQIELLQAARDDADRLYQLIEEWLAGARAKP